MGGPGNIKNLKPWVKGQSGNPAGRVSVLPPEVRKQRRENQAALIRLVIRYFGMTHEEAANRLGGPDVTQLEEAVQGMISRAKEGEHNSFRYLTELVCGKIEETDRDESPAHSLSPQERLEAMKAAVIALEAQVKDDDGSGAT